MRTITSCLAAVVLMLAVTSSFAAIGGVQTVASPNPAYYPPGTVLGRGVSAVDEDRWRQSFAIYLWTAGQDGTAVVRGHPVNVDVSIGDAVDALGRLDGAITGHYEATKGDWTAIADLYWVRLRSTESTELGSILVEPSQTIAELAGGYRIYETRGPKYRPRRAEALLGLRYTELKLKLSGAETSDSGSQHWLDPFIGVRYRQNLSERWWGTARGDIGGFNIGNADKFSWNVLLSFDYDLSKEWGLGLGWRWLDYDYTNGSGSSEFKYDVLCQGPFIFTQYRW